MTPGTWRVLATAGILAGGIAAGLVAPTSVGATGTPLYSVATAEQCPGSCTGSLAAGDQLTVTFNQAAIVSSSWSLTLTDGNTDLTLASPGSTASGSGTTTITFTVGTFSGLAPSLTDLEILGQTGVSAGSAAWDLPLSGEAAKPYLVSSCSEITTPTSFSRVFGGHNCDIGFVRSGPTLPDIFDEIAIPTSDLAGPPDDSAPEVITQCGSASGTDTVYDLSSGATLGDAPCGTQKGDEPALGNTTGPLLDYIPTADLASLEPVGVVESVPSSQYVSATSVGAEITAVNVSGSSATMHFSVPVYCQGGNSAQTAQSFHLISPWWSTDPGSIVYGTSVSCPSESSPGTTVTVGFNSTIPASGASFKYDKWGSPDNILGGAGGLPGEAAVSQSFYAGPAPGAPSVTSFTGATTLTPAGGPVTLGYSTSNATSCSTAVSSTTGSTAGVTVQMPFAYFNEHNATAPESTLAPCPAGAGTVAVSLPANTGAQGVTYTFTLTASGPPGLNGGSSSKTVDVTVSSSSGAPPPPTSTSTSTTSAPTTSTPATTIPPPTTTDPSPAPTSPSGGSPPTTAALATTPGTGGSPPSSPTTTAADAVLSAGHGTSPSRLASRPRVLRLAPARGAAAGGARVLIRGSHFTKRVTVWFGRRRATDVRVVSATAILARCPKGSGVAYVRVHTARGTSVPVRSARFVFVAPKRHGALRRLGGGA